MRALRKSFSIFHFSFFIALLCCAQPGQAAGRADDIVAKLAAEFRSMKGYEVAFTVVAGETSVSGSYSVEGDRYYLTLGDAEVFSDAKTRYEVDNRRREVTISRVDTTSRNLLDNPIRAFDFLGSDYKATLLWELDGKAAVTLTPSAKQPAMSGTATVTVSTAAMRPLSLVYDFEGERVTIDVRSVQPLKSPFKSFSKGSFADYEFIDFR